MTDPIDRQKAIDTANAMFERCDTGSIEDYHDLMVEALKVLPATEPPDEWCTDCKEYDQERHCCPRFNKVIRETLKDIGETNG